MLERPATTIRVGGRSMSRRRGRDECRVQLPLGGCRCTVRQTGSEEDQRVWQAGLGAPATAVI